MKKLNGRIWLLFSIALLLSIGFPAGILCIVFGAVNDIVPLWVPGIVLTVIGFYSMPILWVRYAERRGDRLLLILIEQERIYTVAGLAEQTGYRHENIRMRVKRLIHSRMLVGYLFRDDTLERNARADRAHAPHGIKHCTQCGAAMVYVGDRYTCEYCGHESV